MSPLACDPETTFEFVLDSDKHKPEDRRPTFIFRCRSVAEWGVAERKVNKVKESGTGDEALDVLCEAISGGLVGWRNMINESGRTMTVTGSEGPVGIPSGNHIPYHPENLQQICVVAELWLLYYAGLQGGLAAVEDLKKSASQSPTSTDESAADANAEPSTDSAGV